MARRRSRKRPRRPGSGRAAAPESGPSPGASPRVVARVAIGLGILVAAIYWPVAGHEFVGLDDAAYFLRNPNLDGRFGLDDLVGAFSRTYLANWTPLTSLSIALDNALYGADPAGVLVTNALLHAAASLLLFGALLRLTGDAAPAAFAAAVFAAHPLHVESVAWASQRKDVLMAVGWMAALWTYAAYRERPTAGRYAALLGCAGFALLAKPVAVTLPFALLLLDFWPLKRFGTRWTGLRAAVLEKLPLFGLAALVSGLTWLAQSSEGAHRSVQVALPYRLLNAGLAYGAYLVDSFWPSGLAAHYPYEPDALLGPAALGACAAVLVLTLLAARLADARPHLLVGWLWFLGTLVPMIGIVHVGSQARADRYMYIPLVGLTLALAWEAQRLAERRPGARRALGVAGLAAVAALGLAAHRQVGLWSDSEALFGHAVAVTRDNAFAHTALGSLYRKRGELSRAERHLREALRIRPGSGDARSDLGLVRIDQGRATEARAELERALADGADPAKVQTALGLAAERSGDVAGAIASYRRALRADPGRVEAANNLAWLLATAADTRLRDPQEALRIALPLARWNARDPAVLDTLAAAYAANGRSAEAVATQSRAVALLAEEDAALRAPFERRLEQYESSRRAAPGQP